MAYWSTAESIKRRSLMIRLAWERLRARRNPGTAMAARRAMIATTIMISTRVKAPVRRGADLRFIGGDHQSIRHADVSTIDVCKAFRCATVSASLADYTFMSRLTIRHRLT